MKRQGDTPMAAEPIHVLLVEDNPADARLLAESLRDAGPAEAFRITHVTRLAAAVEALARHRPDVVALDLSLPDSSGLDTVDRLRAVAPGIAVVVLTGVQDEALGLRAVQRGVQDYLVKGMCEGGLAARALRYAVERRRAEDTLRDREARLRAVITTAVDAIITIDERGMIDSVNPAAERLFGYRAEEMVGRNVSLLMPAPYAQEHDRYVADYLRTGRARIIGIGREVVGLRKDGTTFPIDLAVSEFDAGGGRRMFAGIVHDLTGRRRLEREILEAGAAEQRRIGRELHDGLCQQLTGVSFAAEILARKLKRLGGPAADELLPAVGTIGEEIDRMMTETRSLARGLNPVDIRAGGLPSALNDLAERSSATFGVRCRFHRSGAAPAAELRDDGTATHLFRIAQEAVANAVRHGKAAHIDISLTTAPTGALTLAIADDGVGLPAGLPPRDHPGIGLRTMEYRARVVGGTLHVGPAGPQGGTRVTCVLQTSAPARGSAD